MADRSKLTLKGLEVFQAVAQSGSVQEAAKRLGLSVSTTSHHLANLEQAVGTHLLDHGKRPMALTAAGQTLLQRVDQSLGLLRQGITEIEARDPEHMVRRLSIAAIEELDTQVTPVLAQALAKRLPNCALSFLTRPSHETLELVQSEQVDFGIAASAHGASPNLIEVPLLRDPFLVLAPANVSFGVTDMLTGASDLTFLRYSKAQLLGRRVETQLRRLRKDLPGQLEFESTEAILSLIDQGRAWTIATALTFACMPRDGMSVQLLELPEAGFARQLSLYQRRDTPDHLTSLVLTYLRPALKTRLVDPLTAQIPWLRGAFGMVSDAEPNDEEALDDRPTSASDLGGL